MNFDHFVGWYACEFKSETAKLYVEFDWDGFSERVVVTSVSKGNRPADPADYGITLEQMAKRIYAAGKYGTQLACWENDFHSFMEDAANGQPYDVR